jgi:hypothetical protein
LSCEVCAPGRINKIFVIWSIICSLVYTQPSSITNATL